METIGHVAAEPGSIACPSWGDRPVVCPSRNARHSVLDAALGLEMVVS